MSEGEVILFPLTYLGPLELYCRYFRPEEILIEQHDSYQKQSFRNRCDIYGPNGKLSLVIPVKHEHGKRFKVHEIKIDYATDWRRLHWKGIVSAYNSSPYFEYFQDIFEPYFRKQFVFLIDLCLNLNEEVLKIISISKQPGLTNEFYPFLTHPAGDGYGQKNIEKVLDLRRLIHPKNSIENDLGFRSVEYTQVFSQKYGFIPNLSILDLIFNMGPETSEVLRSCLK